MPRRIACNAGLLFSLFWFASSVCHARIVPSWPYELLVKKSDIVAIVEPLENRPASDLMTNDTLSKHWYAAVDTRCKVRGVLKGAVVGELTILHFSYAPEAAVFNGPSFVEFTIKPRRVMTELYSVVDGVKYTAPQSPVWIVFLRHRADSRYEPVAGQVDADISMRRLEEGALRAMREKG